MYRDLIRSRQEATLSEVRLIENRIGVTFPETFREFALKNNGAKFAEAVVGTTSQNRDEYIIELREFVPLCEISLIDMGTPNDALVAFASDSCGNHFVFRRTDMEAVYFWDHEIDETILVRDTFEDFLSAITRSDLDVAIPEDATGWVDPDFLQELKEQGEAANPKTWSSRSAC